MGETLPWARVDRRCAMASIASAGGALPSRSATLFTPARDASALKGDRIAAGKSRSRKIGVAVDAVKKRAGMQPPDRRRISDQAASPAAAASIEQGTSQAAEALSEILEHDEAEFGVAAKECRTIAGCVLSEKCRCHPIP